MWQALQIRVTTFHAGMRRDLKSELVQPIFGEDPESSEVKPAELRRTELASLGPGRLTASSVANRVDWIWEIMPDAPAEATLGKPTDAIEQFVAKLLVWVADQDDVVRVAVGGVFGIPVATQEEGYKLLDHLIKELDVDTSASELLYQINRPCEFTVNNNTVRFNNLEKWFCRRVARGFFSLSNASSAPMIKDEVMALHAACEIDINTDALNVTPYVSAMVSDLLSLAKTQLFGILAR